MFFYKAVTEHVVSVKFGKQKGGVGEVGAAGRNRVLESGLNSGAELLLLLL